LKELWFFMKLSKIFFLSLFLLFFQTTRATELKDLINQYNVLHDVIFCFDNFEKDIFNFIQNKKNKMLESSKWFNGSVPLTDWFDDFSSLQADGNSGVTNKFLPYTQKLIIEPDTRVVFFGDLHGDLDSFMECFEETKNLGLLDENYKIPEKVYFIFLGDYVARGEQGLEILSLLVKFHNQNPGRVFLLRGNHEVLRYSELEKRLEVSPYVKIDSYNYVLKENPCIDILLRRFWLTHCWFDFFPLAIYLGCKDSSGITNFIQCCHAGIEVGYNPKDFLNDDYVQFQMVTELNRETALRDENLAVQMERTNLFALKENPEHEQNKHLVENLNQEDIRRIGFNGLGFLWNDFLNGTYEDEKGEMREFRGIYFDSVRCALAFSNDVTEYYFKKNSSENKILHGCIRGHQHGPPMGYEIAENDGCLKLWGGLVYTLISSFWSASYKQIDLKSFMVLKTANDISEWKIDHYYSSAGEKQFHQKTFNYLDNKF